MSKNHNSFKNLFGNIVSIDNLEEAFCKTQKTDTKYKIDSINFSMNLYENLIQLQKELIGEKYTPQDYNVFKVYEPKERIIAAPKYKDKLVQFALHNVLNPIFEQKFIYNSYSCINGKGTHSCAKKIQKMLAKSKWKFDDPWIIKADISKFFYSIDHDILKKILRKKIKCKRTLKLLELIIDYSPNKVGLPLGNITSQLFANIYLNELDQFCKRKLSLKFYARYMDDFLAIVDGRELAKRTKEKMEEFVEDNLNLIFNPKKSKIFPISQGINIVGYKIHPTHMLIRTKSKKRMKSKLSNFKKMFQKGKMTQVKAGQILNSWKGHADHSCNKNFLEYLINRFDFLGIENGIFQVSFKKVGE